MRTQTPAYRLEILSPYDGWVPMRIGTDLVRMQELAALLPQRLTWRLVPVA